MNNHKLRRYYLEKDYNCAETILRAANEEYHLGLNEDSFRLSADSAEVWAVAGPAEP